MSYGSYLSNLTYLTYLTYLTSRTRIRSMDKSPRSLKQIELNNPERSKEIHLMGRCKLSCALISSMSGKCCVAYMCHDTNAGVHAVLKLKNT